VLEEFTDLMWRHGKWLAEHGTRVARLATSIGQELGMETEQLRRLHITAHLHDVGKVRVDAAVVNKPGPLTPLEWEQMRRHPAEGFFLLDGLVHPDIAAAVLFHHERFDGLGYPYGLSGTAIPLLARVLFVADAFDAITSDRPYEAAFSVETAIDELARCAGTQFDPFVVDAALGLLHSGAPVLVA
jgi:HD-GYP domain-containing protein (c-di-GMP phosphodiesterase class II)